jgi:uncharacterized metal-binding protein
MIICLFNIYHQFLHIINHKDKLIIILLFGKLFFFIYSAKIFFIFKLLIINNITTLIKQTEQNL